MTGKRNLIVLQKGGESAGLPPFQGCRNWDVDSSESVARKRLESKSLGSCPVPCRHTLKITADRSITAKREICNLPWQTMALTNQEELEWNSLRALSQKGRVSLCSLEKEATSGRREISRENYQLLLCAAPSLRHSVSLPGSWETRLLWGKRDSRPILVATQVSFFISGRKAGYFKEW